MCSLVMVDNYSDDATEKKYFDLSSQGGLTVPSSQMAESVCACLLDYADNFIARHNESTIRESAERILETFSKIYFHYVNTLKWDLNVQQKLL